MSRHRETIPFCTSSDGNCESTNKIASIRIGLSSESTVGSKPSENAFAKGDKATSKCYPSLKAGHGIVSQDTCVVVAWDEKECMVPRYQQRPHLLRLVAPQLVEPYRESVPDIACIGCIGRLG